MLITEMVINNFYECDCLYFSYRFKFVSFDIAKNNRPVVKADYCIVKELHDDYNDSTYYTKTDHLIQDIDINSNKFLFREIKFSQMIKYLPEFNLDKIIYMRKHKIKVLLDGY